MNPSRAPRLSSCVLCKQRKIKCDPTTRPCAHCIKAQVECIEGTRITTRTRRRPQQELLERLARCEELLKQQQQGTSSTNSPMTQSPQPRGTDESAPEPVSVEESQTRLKPKSTGGKMVNDKGKVQFMDSQAWVNIHEEIHAIKELIETDEPGNSSAFGSEPSVNNDVLFSDPFPNRSIEDLRPEPIQIFKLWQIFVARVNPIVKVVHVPTVQSQVMAASTDFNSVPLRCQALLYAIFAMAVLSLTKDEALEILGSSRHDYLRRLHVGTKTALAKLDFLNNYDMVVLQTLLLYFFSLENTYNSHATWILGGLIVRLAQKMGYHRDGETLGLTPYETEMRRRIWWQIVLQDSKNALVSGLSHSMLLKNWDTKMPQNVNDADLFPGSSEPIYPREGPTEMGFCLYSYHLAKFLTDAESLYESESTNPWDDDDLLLLPLTQRNKQLVERLENSLNELEERYIDAYAGNIHVFSLALRPILVAKMREMTIPMRQQPEWGTEIFNKKDNLFKTAMIDGDALRNIYEVSTQTGFVWFVKHHFRLDVLAFLVAQLCQRPIGILTDRGWGFVEIVYRYEDQLFDLAQRPFAQQAKLVVRAWDVRHRVHAQAGTVLETPEFVRRLQEALGTARSRTVESAGSSHRTEEAEVEADQSLESAFDVLGSDWQALPDITYSQGQTGPDFYGNQFGPFY
uniref:Zn(2)-C6 fungal-type domain-containing protein n=1 Tax=Bionectria ochroleuca TaxID=29856 RepID=A0A8H7NPN3_BIOOC